MTAPRRCYRAGRFICALYALGLIWAGTVAAADYAREKRWADEITPALVVGDALYLQQASGHKFLALHTPAKNSRAAVIVVHGLGIHPDFYQKNDIHIHLPEGATPKDGPSAGIGLCTAMVSVLTGIPVRADVAMTGEITLRGEVLPIGGLKEKLLAAHRGGIKTVLIPEENVKDLKEIPDNVKNKLDIHPVKWIDQVLELALERKPEALPEQAAVPVPPAGEGVTPAAIKH